MCLNEYELKVFIIGVVRKIAESKAHTLYRKTSLLLGLSRPVHSSLK